MIPVRKPGRPLSCPHPRQASCSCPGRLTSTIAVPRGRRCECWGMARGVWAGVSHDAHESPDQPQGVQRRERRASELDSTHTSSVATTSDEPLFYTPFNNGRTPEQSYRVTSGHRNPVCDEEATTAPWAHPFGLPSLQTVFHSNDQYHPRPEGPAETAMASIPAPISVPVPPIVIHLPACANCSKQSQAVVVHAPPTAPTAELPGSGAAIYNIVIHGSSILSEPDPGIPCLCGPECQCVGCLAHPFNDATERYVQSVLGEAPDRSSPLGAGEDSSTPLTAGSGSCRWAHTPAEGFFFLDYPDLELSGEQQDLRIT